MRIIFLSSWLGGFYYLIPILHYGMYQVLSVLELRNQVKMIINYFMHL